MNDMLRAFDLYMHTHHDTLLEVVLDLAGQLCVDDFLGEHETHIE